MFQTEIDTEQVVYGDPDTLKEQSKIVDEELKNELDKLIKSSRKKGEFRNLEEQILHNVKKGKGIHNIHMKSGRKIPPLVILSKGFV